MTLVSDGARDRHAGVDADAEADRHKRDVVSRTKLAGEPDPWGSVHAFEHRLLGGARNGQALGLAEDADATRRAAPAAAAHMSMRNVVDEARFQDADATGDTNRAIGIG